MLQPAGEVREYYLPLSKEEVRFCAGYLHAWSWSGQAVQLCKCTLSELPGARLHAQPVALPAPCSRRLKDPLQADPVELWWNSN